MTAGTLERVRIGTARRVNQASARHHFNAGGTVVVHDGHETELPVTDVTTVHTRESVSWDDLAGMVTMWRNRYPAQGFYIVTYAPNTCTFPPALFPVESLAPGDVLPAVGCATVDRVEYLPGGDGRATAYVVHYVPGARSRYTGTPLAYGYFFAGEHVHVSRGYVSREVPA